MPIHVPTRTGLTRLDTLRWACIDIHVVSFGDKVSVRLSTILTVLGMTGHYTVGALKIIAACMQQLVIRVLLRLLLWDVLVLILHINGSTFLRVLVNTGVKEINLDWSLRVGHVLVACNYTNVRQLVWLDGLHNLTSMGCRRCCLPSFSVEYHLWCAWVGARCLSQLNVKVHGQFLLTLTVEFDASCVGCARGFVLVQVILLVLVASVGQGEHACYVATVLFLPKFLLNHYVP